MKLKTKIAGSLALPLALAVAANSAQAFTVVDNADQKVAIGGYLSAISSWAKTGNKESGYNNKFNNSLHAGTSRLNLTYIDKDTGTKFFYEQQFEGGLVNASNGLRHAFFETEDGIVGGYTWSFGTNLVALAETIDTDGNSNVSYQAYGPRNLLLGKKFKLDDGLSIGLALEETKHRTNGLGNGKAQKSVLPAVVANFQGEFGDTKVFAAWTNYAFNVVPVGTVGDESGKDKRANRLTFGTDIGLGDANVKLGLTHNFGKKYDGGEVISGARNAKGTHVSAALGFQVNEKIRTNLATEYSKWNKKAIHKKDNTDKAGNAYRVWLNGFYQADNGIEWGAEVQMAKVKAEYKGVGGVVVPVTYSANETHQGFLADKGTAVRLQAKYAF